MIIQSSTAHTQKNSNALSHHGVISHADLNNQHLIGQSKRRLIPQGGTTGFRS